MFTIKQSVKSYKVKIITEKRNVKLMKTCFNSLTVFKRKQRNCKQAFNDIKALKEIRSKHQVLRAWFRISDKIEKKKQNK